MSASPHVPRIPIRDSLALPPLPLLKPDQLNATASAPIASPTQSSLKHASSTPEKEQAQQPQSRSYPRAHRQLFATHVASSNQVAQQVPQQQPQQQSAQQLPAMQSSEHLASSPRQSTEDSDVLGYDQARVRGLQLYSRQRLFLCKLCHNPSRGLLCEPSSMQKIEFYKGSDVPLASYVAASAPHKCPHPACGDGVASHLRTFLHNRGRITLSVNQTAPGKELPGADKGQVWFWARPLHVSLFLCRHSNALATSGRKLVRHT